MSDLFYRGVRGFGRKVFAAATKTLVLHEDRARLAGGFLLAANHHSIYDAPILIATTTRLVDWVSFNGLFQKSGQRGFMHAMNCLPLDRSRRGVIATRAVIRRLAAGRVIGLFPEAGLRKIGESVLHGGDFASGVVRLASLSGVPIVPVVVLGAGQYHQAKSWLPLGRTFVAVNYGEPIHPPSDRDRQAAFQKMEESLSSAFRFLFHEIQTHSLYQQNASEPWWRNNFAPALQEDGPVMG